MNGFCCPFWLCRPQLTSFPAGISFNCCKQGKLAYTSKMSNFICNSLLTNGAHSAAAHCRYPTNDTTLFSPPRESLEAKFIRECLKQNERESEREREREREREHRDTEDGEKRPSAPTAERRLPSVA